MPRTCRFTYEEFKRAYKQGDSFDDIAAILDCTPLTVRLYCRRFKMKAKTNNAYQKEKRRRDRRITDMYRGERSLESIASEEGISMHTVRNCIIRRLSRWHRWADKSYPQPKELSQLKVYYIMQAENTDDVDRIVSETGLAESTVQDYIDQVFKFSTKDN